MGRMEPEATRRRLTGVNSESVAVPGVFDLESRLDVALSGPALGAEFHDFYAATRDHIGRALALVLGDADLAADAVDEAMVRAFQRWFHDDGTARTAVGTRNG